MTAEITRPQDAPAAGVSPESAEPADVREARHWLANVYRGDTTPQLTPRAVVSGMAIGAVMSVSNLYVGLKTGWGLGVTITSCILAYAVFKALEAVIPAYRRRPFSILENNTMSSAASAAGYMASAGLVSAIPALYMTTGMTLSAGAMMAWLMAISVLGVFMAVPLKRQMINVDKLPFPTGLATAETLRSMHTAGAEAIAKARSLLYSAVIGSVVALWRDGLPLLGAPFARFAFPAEIPLYPGGAALMQRLTVGFEGSLIMVAAGAIMGIRVGVSLLIGAIIFYGVIGPQLIDAGIVQPGYRGIVSWTLWPATALMVTSGLLSFALRWRTVARALSGLFAIFGRRPEHDDPLARVEVPGSWFLLGTLLSGVACVVLGHYLFGISWWMGVIAVLATFLLSIVAARATGETDVTPIGAMGKITQLIFGAVAPNNVPTNLMTASITAGAASHAADLLTDLKSGYELGGNPRKQTLAQLFGIVAGTLMCVPVYAVIAQPEKLGSTELPAPAARVWASVAELLKDGIEALPPYAPLAMLIGALVGVALTLLEEFAPAKVKRWLPSSTGLGIAGVIPAFNAISMFVGALAAWLLMKARPQVAERYTIPASSGLIAGESLMGVAIILASQGPGLIRAVFGW